MKPPTEEIFQKVRQWIDHADEDLRLATYALKMRGKNRTFRLVAYHAQQCAEKYLKGYLVFCGVDFPYTHNISVLLELCGEKTDWPAKLKDAEELTSYVITTRYPGEGEEVTKTDADRAIKIAQQVRNQVRSALKQLGFKLSN
jgi:HEPN domain-containing protein